MEPQDKVTIDKIDNIWLGEGFISTPDGFTYTQFNYNTKEHSGGLSIYITEQ